VAFGPITEDYQVLQDMAAQLPRQSFQKLGLNALGLKTAFSSLASDLSTMNTQMMPQKPTVRKVKQQEAGKKCQNPGVKSGVENAKTRGSSLEMPKTGSTLAMENWR
jgi:hypothetical protein